MGDSLGPSWWYKALESSPPSTPPEGVNWRGFLLGDLRRHLRSQPELCRTRRVDRAAEHGELGDRSRREQRSREQQEQRRAAGDVEEIAAEHRRGCDRRVLAIGPH